MNKPARLQGWRGTIHGGRMLAKLLCCLACLFALSLNCAFAGEDTRQLSKPASDILYGLMMASMANRNFDNLEGSIDELVARTEPGDLNRLKSMLLLAKLGKKQAEKALASLEGWTGIFSGYDEEFRISVMADIQLYYLDQPEQAAKNYEMLVRGRDVRTPYLLSALFTVYSGHRRTFDLGKMEYYLKEMQRVESPKYLGDWLVFQAASGEKQKARDGLKSYESKIPAEYLTVAKVYLAPVVGWLGDVDQVVDYLEKGLQEQAINYAPGGFRLYCDWVRQSPAYDSVRQAKRFSDMWDRLYKYEPPGRGGTVYLPDGGGKGATFVPEPAKK